MWSPRKALQIGERFRVGLGFGFWLLLIGQSVLTFFNHFADFTDENLCRWTAFALVIDTVRPSSNVALNVIASLSKSALIKPFSLRKVFPLVVLIEIIGVTY